MITCSMAVHAVRSLIYSSTSSAHLCTKLFRRMPHSCHPSYLVGGLPHAYFSATGPVQCKNVITALVAIRYDVRLTLKKITGSELN